MEIAELVLKYIQVLVWPLATVALVWGLRAPIKKALGRVSRVETLAGSMEFSEEARDVRDDAEEITESAPENAQVAEDAIRSHEMQHGDSRSAGRQSSRALERREDQTAPGPQGRRILRFGTFQEAMEAAHVSPVAAVISAWAALDALCLTVISDAGIDMPVPRRNGTQPLLAVFRGLVDLGVPDETLNVYDRLRQLRVRAMDNPETVSISAARDFVRSCETVGVAVRAAAPDAIPDMPGPS